MPPLTRSRAVRSSGTEADIARERGLLVWKVATMGTSASQHASSDRLGAAGSCTCSRSKSPSRSQARTRAAARGPKDSRATDPL
jgi:hypothetical protein